MKICQDCGKPIPEDIGGKIAMKRFCPDCVRAHKKAAAQRRRERQMALDDAEPFRKPVKSIAEVQREARAAAGLGDDGTETLRCLPEGRTERTKRKIPRRA